MHIKFNSIFDAINYKRSIDVHALVTGKAQSPFTIPKKILIKCINREKCPTCTIPGSTIEIKSDNNNVIQFIDIPSTNFSKIIKVIINRFCKTLIFEILEVQNVERIYISSPTGRHREKSSTIHMAYFAGYGIESNYNYDMHGMPTIDPETQEATIVFDSAKKLKTDAESFRMTNEIHEQLKQFNVSKPVEEIYEYLYKLYENYALNITQIYERFDLHLAIDLACRTPLSFKFANEQIDKGWADIMIIGDSKTGKGQVGSRLIKYLNIGEVVGAENCSYAGLVAGLEQYKGRWAVSWGRIPLNDGGLIILDESTGLKERWEDLSGIRSDGIATVDKIIKASTNARVRLIAIANPVKKKIGNYAYGIQALNEIFKNHEDITRFDYVVVVADTEVADSTVNKVRQSTNYMYTQEAEQSLILWTWSRKQDDIKFTDKAVQVIYTLASKLGAMYASDVPLIQGTNVRIKLAKIAVAFAARLYSNRDNGKILLVDEVHIDCAFAFLNMIYKKQCSGYYTMSQLSKSVQATYTNEGVIAIDKYLTTFANNKTELCKCLLNNNILTSRDIAEHLNFSNEIAIEIISKLLKLNLIKKHFQNTYVKNKHFTEWLKDQVLTANNLERQL